MAASSSPEPAPRSVAIVGAGICGLSAALRLINRDPAVRVTIVDAADRPGGIIQTKSIDGFLAELGPDSFITNKPAGVRLCESLDFAHHLLPTDTTHRRSLVLHNGRPVPVPDGFMLMAPAKPWNILTTPVLSWTGKLRLLSEAVRPPRPSPDDESLASFVRRRFGQETLDRLVQPLIGGIYTSDPEKLSLHATLPRFPELERTHGSVIRGTLAQQRRKQNSADAGASGARYGLFATPKHGLGSLVAALEERLRSSGRVELRFRTAVKRIVRIDRGWQLHFEDHGRQPLSFDSLVCTLPAHRAAQLLAESASELAEQLRRIEYASSAIVVSGHRLSDFQHPLDAFGLVIPHREQRQILAVSFTSRKFPGRAPEGCVLLRTFVGGAMQPDVLQHSDDRIQQIVTDELTQILGMRHTPIFQLVQRYHNAMPQYHVGHLQLVEQIETLTRQLSGLELAGNAYRGVGIPDSIASGESAADRVLAADRR